MISKCSLDDQYGGSEGNVQMLAVLFSATQTITTILLEYINEK